MAANDHRLDSAARELTGLSQRYSVSVPKMNQPVVAAWRALRILQLASTLDAIGQCWLGSLAGHLAAAVPLTIPLMMHVFTDYRSTLLAIINTGATDEQLVLAFPE